MEGWLDDEAAGRWAAFPVDAVPRPVVLLEPRLRVEGGFSGSGAKQAWLDGAVRPVAPMPPGLAALLPGGGSVRARNELAVTGVDATAATFLCDRGPRRLPAYRLQVAGLDGSCVVLSPDVPCWWAPDGHAPRPHREVAEIERDGVTLHIPAFGGVLTEFLRAEFQEHGTFVVGRAVTAERPAPPGTAVVALGVGRLVAGRLRAPLGGRVLVDTSGQPLAVVVTGTTPSAEPGGLEPA